jgi:hypothetical protein
MMKVSFISLFRLPGILQMSKPVNFSTISRYPGMRKTSMNRTISGTVAKVLEKRQERPSPTLPTGSAGSMTITLSPGIGTNG